MAKIVVDVMLRAEIADPQGEAILGACHRLGFAEVVSVRQGKRFELEFSETSDGSDGSPATEGSSSGPAAIRAAELAAELLANPVIEEFTLRTA